MQREKSKDVVLECHEMWSHVLKHTKKHQKTPKHTKKHQKTMENVDFGQKRRFLPYDGWRDG